MPKSTLSKVASKTISQNVASVLESIQEAFFIIDREWRLVFLNGKAEEIFQQKASEMVGRSIFEASPKFKKSGFFKFYKRAYTSGRRVEFEEYYEPAKRWYSGSIYPASDGLYVHFSDITAEKRRSKELRFLSEAGVILSSSLDYDKTLNRVIRLAVETVSDWCAAELVGEDGKVTRLAIGHADPKKIKLAQEFRKKYPPNPNAPDGSAEVVRTGKSFVMTHIPDELLVKAALNEEHLSMIRALGIASYMIAPMKIGAKVLGTITFVSSSDRQLYTNSDLPLAEGLAARAALAIENARLYRSAQLEIDMRQKTEERLLLLQEELRLSKDQLETIIQSSSDGITLQDDSGKLIYANDTAAYMVGFSSPEALISATSKEVFNRFEMIDESGAPFALERLPGRRALKGEVAPEEKIGYRVKKTGKERWSSVRATPLLDNEGHVKYAVNVFHDVTDQKLQEKRKNEFISIASHELKTPVATLKILSQALRDLPGGKEAKKKKEIIGRVENQLDRITGLTRDLLDVSKISSGTLEIRPTSFNLVISVSEIVNDFRGMTSKHEISLDSPSRVVILADQARFEQVIGNLLSNAIKYSPRGGKIRVKISSTKNSAVISVQDQGTGVSADNKSRIFESFFRENNGSSTAQGLGMGLFICSEIVKLHKGSIRVESQPNKGSTFYVEFPKNRKRKIGA